MSYNVLSTFSYIIAFITTPHIHLVCLLPVTYNYYVQVYLMSQSWDNVANMHELPSLQAKSSCLNSLY